MQKQKMPTLETFMSVCDVLVANGVLRSVRAETAAGSIVFPKEKPARARPWRCPEADKPDHKGSKTARTKHGMGTHITRCHPGQDLKALYRP